MAIPVDCPLGTRDVDTTLREGIVTLQWCLIPHKKTHREKLQVFRRGLTTEDLSVSQISYLGKTDCIPLWEHHGYGDIT